jgi:hypothetical protein
MSSSRSCFFLRDGNIVGCRGRKRWPHSAQRQRQSRSCRHRHQHQRRSRSPLRIEHESPDGWRHGSSPGRPITAFTVGGRSCSARSGSSLSTTMTGRVSTPIARQCGSFSKRRRPAVRGGGRLSIKTQRGRRHRHDRRRNQIASATWSAASSPRRDVTFLATPRAIASHSSSVLARMASAARSATMPGRTYSVLCNSRFAFTQHSILSPQPRNLSAAGNEFSVLNLQFDNIQSLRF